MGFDVMKIGLLFPQWTSTCLGNVSILVSLQPELTMETAIKYIGKRISFQEDADKLSIIVLGKEEGNRPMLRALWLFAWLIIGAFIVKELNNLSPEDELRIVLFVFMGFWTYYLFRVLRALYWQWKGRESILLKKDEAVMKEAFGNLGKAFTLQTSNLVPMKIREKESGFFALFDDSFWSIGKGELQFQVDGRVYYFGKRLSEGDRDALMKVFNKNLKSFQ